MSRYDPREVLSGPVVAAPMAGGPSTPALVTAVTEAGALGFLGGGYQTAPGLRSDIEQVKSRATGPFGVNLFVPTAPAADADEVAAYLKTLGPDAAALSSSISTPTWDDDHFDDKVEVLVDLAPAVVSFTFGCPDRGLIERLQDRGCQVWVTVTNSDEATIAVAAGADALGVQGFEAGGHRGTFGGVPAPAGEPDVYGLVGELAGASAVPVLAAGGITDREAVQRAVAAGALAAMCGTAFLRSPESGATTVYKAALADPTFDRTAVTRAFSGRPAWGLLNQFMIDHPRAPSAYPQINNATKPMRAAAIAAGDPHRVNLWAGTSWQAAQERPAAEIVEVLRGG